MKWPTKQRFWEGKYGAIATRRGPEMFTISKHILYAFTFLIINSHSTLFCSANYRCDSSQQLARALLAQCCDSKTQFLHILKSLKFGCLLHWIASKNRCWWNTPCGCSAGGLVCAALTVGRAQKAGHKRSSKSIRVFPLLRFCMSQCKKQILYVPSQCINFN